MLLSGRVDGEREEREGGHTISVASVTLQSQMSLCHRAENLTTICGQCLTKNLLGNPDYRCRPHSNLCFVGRLLMVEVGNDDTKLRDL